MCFRYFQSPECHFLTFSVSVGKPDNLFEFHAFRPKERQTSNVGRTYEMSIKLCAVRQSLQMYQKGTLVVELHIVEPAFTWLTKEDKVKDVFCGLFAYALIRAYHIDARKPEDWSLGQTFNLRSKVPHFVNAETRVNEAFAATLQLLLVFIMLFIARPNCKSSQYLLNYSFRVKVSLLPCLTIVNVDNCKQSQRSVESVISDAIFKTN
jgi:hypothetical protein